MKKRIAFFGGGFNPPHIAHVMGLAYARVMGQFDRIFVTPCWQHAFEKDSNLIDFDHRLAMCERAFSGMPDVFVSSMERLLKIRYTVDLMEAMRVEYPEDDLFIIIGSDNEGVMHSWHRWQDLGALVEFFVMPRPDGTESRLPFTLPDISSTDIRMSLESGPSGLGHARTMLPPKVLDYIIKNKLYGTSLLSAAAE